MQSHELNKARSVGIMSEQESFCNQECFAVITDKTKPAMKLTIDELASRGKRVYVVDMVG
jgi:hypothetical protein